MPITSRPKLGEATNRANLRGGLLKPAPSDGLLNVKALLNAHGRRVNDENADVNNLNNKFSKIDCKAVSEPKKNSDTVFRSRIPVLQPQQTRMVKNPSRNAIQSSLHPVIAKNLIINIDTDSNIFLLSEYAQEIYNYLFELESKRKLKSKFMLNFNRTISSHARAVLVDWIVSVHAKFGSMQNETLYLTVSIIDRYLANTPITKNELQLLGATALFVAAKFEEIYFPDVNDLIKLCGDLYTKRDFLKMELRVLDRLNFEFGTPLTIHFLRRGSKAADSDSNMHMMSKFLCELCLTDYECASWPASLMAASALYVSLRMYRENNGKRYEDGVSFGKTSVWTPTIQHYTGYSEQTLMEFVPNVCRTIVQSETAKFTAVRKKYANQRCMRISLSPLLKSEFISCMASKQC